MKKENIFSFFIDGKEYNIILSNISNVLYNDSLTNKNLYQSESASIISEYSKNGKLGYIPSNDQIEKELTASGTYYKDLSEYGLLFGVNNNDMINYIWFRSRLEYEWSSWNNGFSVKKESLKSFQEKVLRHKFKDVNKIASNTVMTYDLIQTKEPPNWDIMVGYPVTNYINSIFGTIPNKDYITIKLEKISSRRNKNKEGDSSFSVYKRREVFFNYYVEKIDDEGINTYLNDKKIPYILKCVYRDGYIYYVDTWVFCILSGINIINGPMMNNNDIYRRLVEPTISVSSYYIKESF